MSKHPGLSHVSLVGKQRTAGVEFMSQHNKITTSGHIGIHWLCRWRGAGWNAVFCLHSISLCVILLGNGRQAVKFNSFACVLYLLENSGICKHNVFVIFNHGICILHSHVSHSLVIISHGRSSSILRSWRSVPCSSLFFQSRSWNVCSHEPGSMRWYVIWLDLDLHFRDSDINILFEIIIFNNLFMVINAVS